MSDLDFDAWEAPPPPEGLADAVIARMGGTAVGLAMPGEEPPPRRRRWVIAASAAVVLVAAGGLWAIVRNREPAPPASGAVLADRAQRLELGGVSAELDSGAFVRWHRTPRGLDIDQRAGTALWRVGEDEQVVIGAASASIEAAGASLRVEVPMNMSDARVIGASAVTAAAVALVTVVVYEGHVKVSSNGQTVVVQPGTTYRVVQPPAPPVVGVAPVTVANGKPKLAVLGLEGWSGDDVPSDLAGDLRARVAIDTSPFQLAPASDKELTDEKLLHGCANEAPACMAAIANELGADQLIYGSIASPRAGYTVTLNLFDVSRKQVTRTLTQLIPADESQGAALEGWAIKLYAQLTDAQPGCDADALTRDGKAAMARNDSADALVKFDAAYACKPGTRAVQLAFMAACNAANVTKASEYWDKLALPARAQLLQMCVRNGIVRDQLDPSSCDVDALTQKGMEQEQVGQHAAALAAFERGIGCQPSTRLYELSFMAACNAKSVSKSSYYWKKLPSNVQAQLQQLCMRNGISRDQLDSTSAPPPPDLAPGQGEARIDGIPAAKILIDGKPAGATPLTIKLPAGKHKVTYVIGEDRFTYPLVITAGATETVSKDLQ